MPPRYRTRSTTAAGTGTGTSSGNYETRAGTSSQMEGLNKYNDLLKCRATTEQEPVVLVPEAKMNPWNAFEKLKKGKDLKIKWNELVDEEKQLYKKIEHKVKATIQCNTGKFIDAVEDLDPERLRMLKDSPFHKLLELKHDIQRNAEIQQLVPLFNTEKRCFEIEGDEYAVTAADFSEFMGVQDGEEIIGMKMEAPDDLKKVFSMGKAYIDVEEVVQQLKTSVDEDNVKRAYALLALRYIICAPYSRHLPSRLLALVQDVSALNQKKWATYAIECLVEDIKRFKKSKGKREKYIGGCSIFLQLYAEKRIPKDKLPWGRDDERRKKKKREKDCTPKTLEGRNLAARETVHEQFQEHMAFCQNLRKKNDIRYKSNKVKKDVANCYSSAVESRIKEIEVVAMKAYEKLLGGVAQEARSSLFDN